MPSSSASCSTATTPVNQDQIAHLDVPASGNTVLRFLNNIAAIPYTSYRENLHVDFSLAHELLDLAELLGCDAVAQDARFGLYNQASAPALFHKAISRDCDRAFLNAAFKALDEKRIGKDWNAANGDGLGSLPTALLVQIIGRGFGPGAGTDTASKWPTRDPAAMRSVVEALKGSKEGQQKVSIAAISDADTAQSGTSEGREHRADP